MTATTWFTGKPGSICTAWELMSWAGEPSHKWGIITASCPYCCAPENQAADEGKQGAAERSSRNHDCHFSLAWWGALSVRLTSHWTFSIWLEKICSGILWGLSSLAGHLCFKIDQRSKGWWRFGSKRAQKQAHKKSENGVIQISSLEGTKTSFG